MLFPGRAVHEDVVMHVFDAFQPRESVIHWYAAEFRKLIQSHRQSGRVPQSHRCGEYGVGPGVGVELNLMKGLLQVKLGKHR